MLRRLRPAAKAHMLEPLPRCSDGRPAARGGGVVAGQGLGDVLVGQAVEAVAAHAAVGDRARQGEGLRHLRLGAMERGVEAGHLGQLGCALHQRPDRGEVVRLVQGRERNVLFQRREHGCIDANGSGVGKPAVDDAVADADEALFAQLVAEEREQMVERAVVTQGRAVAPAFFAERASVAILGNEVRRRIQPLGLAAGDQLQRRAGGREERELETRRARIENGDRLAHVTSPLSCAARSRVASKRATSARRGYSSALRASWASMRRRSALSRMKPSASFCR